VTSLFDWMGGEHALERLTSVFYAKVRTDPLLAPVFARMPADHPQHVAKFIGEVLGGPAQYSNLRGKDAHLWMMTRHLGRHLGEAQRKRWMDLLLASADEIGIPADPEFRSAFVGYLEWGTRIAVQVSQTDGPLPDPGPMPHWGWGETGGPYSAARPSSQEDSQTKKE